METPSNLLFDSHLEKVKKFLYIFNDVNIMHRVCKSAVSSREYSW